MSHARRNAGYVCGCDRNIRLAEIIPAPSQQYTICPQRQAVIITRGNRNYVCCVVWHIRLSKRIITPGDNTAIALQHKAVRRPGRNRQDIGCRRRNIGLALGTITPDDDVLRVGDIRRDQKKTKGPTCSDFAG
jgi:hypothetical protein